jgi:hypothetical protein
MKWIGEKATYVIILVAISLAGPAVIAIAIILQIAEFGRSGLRSYVGLVGSSISIARWAVRTVIVVFVYGRTSLGTARTCTGVSKAHLIASVLTVGLGGVGINPVSVIIPVAPVVPPASINGAKLVKACVREAIETVVKHVLIGNVRAGKTIPRWLLNSFFRSVITAAAKIGIRNTGLVAGKLAIGLGWVGVTAKMYE